MAFAKDADPAMKQMPGKTSIDLILPANKLAPIKKQNFIGKGQHGYEKVTVHACYWM